MTKSPNVIFKSKYCLALNNVDNKRQSINYKDDRKKDIDDMIDYFSNEKKSVVGMFEYYMGHTRNEHINLVLEDGKYASKKNIQELKNDYKNYIQNSNLWKGIISFNPEYINNNITIKKLEEKFAKEIMPQFLKYCGFKDLHNMSYVFSVHTNKKHPHIHFAFIEKNANYQYCDNKVNYRRRGKITKDEQRYLKRLVELVIERERFYTPLLTKTNTDIDDLKTYFNPNEKNFILNNVNEIYIEEKILKLGDLLKEYRTINNQKSEKIKYNSIKNNALGKEIKALTKEIKQYLFRDESSSIYNCSKEVKNDIDILNKYFNELDKNNNLEEKVLDNSIANKKSEYIDNYIYNSIVNHALFKYNRAILYVKNNADTITIEELIQELALKNNNTFNDDFHRRKHVLNNYLKNSNSVNMFPSKNKIEKSIRNINYEMEQASQEFSKLFDNEKQK